MVAASATFTGGKMAGNAGCNQYTAGYALDGDTIAISGVVTTEMACPETSYFAALDKAATYAFNGDRLQLRAVDGPLLVEYRATLE